MRLENYLTESKDEDFLKAFKHATDGEHNWQEVKFTTKPYFKEMGKDTTFLYRGMKNHDEYGKRYVRTNRQPMDIQLELHDFIGDLLKKKFGWNPRSEGMFCTSKISSVGQYGMPYIVFPINDFRFIWSPRIHDLYMFTEMLKQDGVDAFISTQVRKRKIETIDDKYKLYGDIKDSHFDFRKNHKFGGLYKKYIEYLITEYGDYRENNFKEAVNSGHEIMIKCEKYWYFSYSRFNIHIEELVRRDL